MKYNYLPKTITVNFGLINKLHLMNQLIPIKDRFEGLCLIHANGIGVVMNNMTDEVYAEYRQFTDNKYKLVEV